MAIGWPVAQTLAQSDSTKQVFSIADSTVLRQQVFVRGVINESAGGRRVPLTGATVRWLNTSVGTVTDSLGQFQVPVQTGQNRLVISLIRLR